jgi:SAM-dependent methyltransferase
MGSGAVSSGIGFRLDLKCASTCTIRDPTTQKDPVQLRQQLIARVRAQFGRPTGFPGRIAGWVMGYRSSNRRRNAWAVALLEVERDDRVLEIGFGPGIAIRELARLAPDGHVCGLDHSEVMVRQAARRNADGVRRGRVELRLGSVERVPAFEVPFDKILAVNALQFWDQPVEPLRELRRVLRSGGRIAIAFQPRGPGASDHAARTRGQQIATALRDAGFSHVRLQTLKLKPAVVCALAVNPSDGDVPPRARQAVQRGAAPPRAPRCRGL